jgi:hypothetical protein
LIWHIEAQLELIKLMLSGPCHGSAALRCRRLTVQLKRVQTWPPVRCVCVLRRLVRRRPDYIAWLYSEAQESTMALAYAIAGAT